MRAYQRWFLLAVVALGGIAPQAVEAQAPFTQRYPVPPLPEGIEWLNTDGPLELSDLRGKFVLLDFWTYCCINCMHILPELDKLEKAYPRNLVVIGVHSAKFEAEKDAQNIDDAIERYEIKHPVINDANHVLWDRFGVQVWPTLILIDPQGYAVWGSSGETTFEKLNAVLRPAVAYYRGKGLLNEQPLVFRKNAAEHETPLRFPGKVLADEAGGRLFVADSNHNRIVIAGLDGTLVDTVGSGEVGLADGDFAAARFNHPQGMALHGDALYVADTENHAIRKLDLAARTVTTVAGTGVPLRQIKTFRPHSNPGKTLLSSPWALCIVGDNLYVAMAGTHQIWRMGLQETGATIGPFAGNGREDIVDGRLLSRGPYELGSASFAQPSGLTSDGTWLYVADSEGSSIRAVPLDPTARVKTVLGTSALPAARLFTFGDVDGPPGRARLQHPLGVVYYQGTLYVADTYNNKIKAIDPKTGAVTTIASTTFDEPTGLTAAAGKLYVADTNNHAIRVIDLAAGNEVTTLAITGLGSTGS